MFIAWITGLITGFVGRQTARWKRRRTRVHVRRELDALPSHISRDLDWPRRLDLGR